MGGNILALSRDEKLVYFEHKKFIRENAETWVEVWKRVLEIREKRWYLTDYTTFAAFCEDVLGLRPRMVRYWMAAVRDVETMALNGSGGSGSGTTVPPPSEGALRKARASRSRAAVLEADVVEVTPQPEAPAAPDPYAHLSRKELVTRIHRAAIELKFAQAENKVGALRRLSAQILALAGNLQRNLSKPTEIAL